MLIQPADEGLAIYVDTPADPDDAFLEAVPGGIEYPPPERRLGKCRIGIHHLVDREDVIAFHTSTLSWLILLLHLLWVLMS